MSKLGILKENKMSDKKRQEKVFLNGDACKQV
jgi:hypothetical protein